MIKVRHQINLRAGNGFHNAEVSISSFDAEYSAGPLSLNALIANGEHENTAVSDSDFSGSYFTAGYEIWRSGEKAIIHLLDYLSIKPHDTVKEIEETTLGLHVPLSNQFVLKADLMTTEQAGKDDVDTFSVGFGMMFQ